jgi:hypothetical protein
MSKWSEQTFLKRWDPIICKMFNISKHQRNAHQNHSETSPLQLQWLQSKRPEKMTNAGKDTEKEVLLHTVDGNVNLHTYNNSIEVPQK